jgi:hypothetical protein
MGCFGEFFSKQGEKKKKMVSFRYFAPFFKIKKLNYSHLYLGIS